MLNFELANTVFVPFRARSIFLELFQKYILDIGLSLQK